MVGVIKTPDEAQYGAAGRVQEDPVGWCLVMPHSVTDQVATFGLITAFPKH